MDSNPSSPSPPIQLSKYVNGYHIGIYNGLAHLRSADIGAKASGAGKFETYTHRPSIEDTAGAEEAGERLSAAAPGAEDPPPRTGAGGGGDTAGTAKASAAAGARGRAPPRRPQGGRGGPREALDENPSHQHLV